MLFKVVFHSLEIQIIIAWSVLFFSLSLRLLAIHPIITRLVLLFQYVISFA
jgi:hypothetical protein